ncbi:hypothetical protein [Streptomyces sp. NPDC059278]|uniref:hypothetical protein n=1 Tax=Streptomyces sp. NPDC059278 TaxID=3346801 RepID=UPI0036A7344E
MTAQPTAYLVLLREGTTAVATDLATAQAAALADRNTPNGADQYENRWDEHTPSEWRLMTRHRARGGRWSWTQRAIRAVPLIQGIAAEEQGAKGLSIGHVCDNCDGIDPDTCLTNSDRRTTLDVAEEPGR